MGEMKPTPGPWNFYTEPQPNGCPIVGNSDGLMVAMVAHSVNYQDQKEAALSDARLIAEAGTVFHNTGLSPVQLVEMVKELKAALNLWLGTANEPNAGWRGAGGSDVLFACEHCGKKHEDCTRLEHACDCPITLARAALAKCEGVGNG